MRLIIWILLIICFAISIYAFFMTFVFKLYFARTQEEISKVQKMIRINESFNKWLELKQNNYRLKGYFENNNYKSVAIYGMGDLGKRLFRELVDDGVLVSYTIDRNIGVDDKYKMIVLPERLPEVDVVIVTAVSSFDDIYLDLKGRFNGEIVSIEDVLWSI